MKRLLIPCALVLSATVNGDTPTIDPAAPIAPVFTGRPVIVEPGGLIIKATGQPTLTSYSLFVRTAFAADENASPLPVNGLSFTQDALDDDFADLLASP